MKLCAHWMFLMAVMAVSATSVLAQNLITNPTFDAGYSGWTGSATWVADDCCGDLASGSVEVGLFDEGLNSNCMEVTGGSSYDLTFWSKFVPYMQQASNGEVQVVWTSDAACAPAFQFPSFPHIALESNAAWQHNGATFVAPLAAHSVYIFIEGAPCGIHCGGTTFFDDVAFGPAGTVPVELQSFEID